MAMIVTVQDDQDPYSRTGRATQQDDGSWWIEYFRDSELLGVHSMYACMEPAEAEALPDGAEMPRLLDQDEADVALFMCETLADPEQFAGIFPEPGYQRNRHVWPADRCTLCFETPEFHDGVRADHPFTGPVPAAGDPIVRHEA